jgi:hypothetical protein
MIQPDDSIRVKIAGLQVDAKEFVRIATLKAFKIYFEHMRYLWIMKMIFLFSF